MNQEYYSEQSLSAHQQAPHRVAPQQQAPHRAAPQQQAPHRVAPQQQAPHRAAPQQQAPHRAAPQQQAPHRAAPQQQAPHRAAPQQQAPHLKQNFVGHHVYGGKSALSFDCSFKGEKPVVNISAAYSKGPKSYDWDRKLMVMITNAEWPEVLCVLLGIKPSVTFKYHGPQKSKGYTLMRQQGGVFVQVFDAGGVNHSVPVGGADLFHVTAMMLGHYAQGIPGVSAGELPNMLAATVGQCQNENRPQ